MKPRIHSLLVAAIAGVWLYMLAAPRAQSALSKYDASVARTMLRQVHDDLAKHYYDPSFHGVDLDAAFTAAERRLTTVATMDEAVAIVAAAVLQLGDSHTTFLPPNRAVSVDYGWQMAMVGDVPLITAVDAASDAAARGLAPGDRVLLLNAVEPSRRNLARLTYFYRFVAPQMRQQVAVLKPDGSARTLVIASRVVNKSAADVDNLLADIERTLDRARDRLVPVGDEILVWKMAVFGKPESVQAAMRRARGHHALVLDLRGNGGGAAAALKELVGGCFDKNIVIATEQRRDKRVREIAKPARDGFTGALFVLVDSQSASAAEIFARVVQLEKRGRVIGDRTAGAVMTSRLFPHRVEGLDFYATSITIGDVRLADGASLENTGVEPDDVVLPTAADLAAGRDPALAAAIAAAGMTMTPEEAGRLFK